MQACTENHSPARTRIRTHAHTHTQIHMHTRPQTHVCAHAHTLKSRHVRSHTITYITLARDTRNKTWHARPQERTRKDWTAVNGWHSPQKHLTVPRQQRRQRASDWTAPEGHAGDKGQGDTRVESSGGDTARGLFSIPTHNTVHCLHNFLHAL